MPEQKEDYHWDDNKSVILINENIQKRHSVSEEIREVLLLLSKFLDEKNIHSNNKDITHITNVIDNEDVKETESKRFKNDNINVEYYYNKKE